MSRIDGDYFFVANDGETLCRVGSYEEDGSAEGITGRFWIAWTFNGTLSEVDDIVNGYRVEDFADRWSRYWREVAFMQRTRRDAITAALACAAKEVMPH